MVVTSFQVSLFNLEVRVVVENDEIVEISTVLFGFFHVSVDDVEIQEELCARTNPLALNVLSTDNVQSQQKIWVGRKYLQV